MASSPLQLLDVPDPALRLDKSLWRQTRKVLADAFGSALVDSIHSPRVGLLNAPGCLPGALGVDLDLPVEAVVTDASYDPTQAQYHLLGVLSTDGSTPPERMTEFRDAMCRLRVTGALVVVATVVSNPRSPSSVRPPSLSELLEELTVASGGTLQTEEIASIRWTGEPIIRGVALTMRYLHAREA